MRRPLKLTEGSITVQLFRLSGPIIFAMLTWTLYFIVDLYFVSRLGPHAVAAVSISGNVFFVMMGFSQTIGIGGMALIAQAFGKGEEAKAGQVFKQSIILSLITGFVIAIIGLSTAHPFIKFFGGTGQSLIWGVEYFSIFSAAFLFLLPLSVMGHCFRGMGDTKTPMLIMLQATILNIILDPILIFGLLGFPELGVKGAAIASLLSHVYGLIIYAYLFLVKGTHIKITRSLKINFSVIKNILFIGLPSGLTFFLLALNMLITYRVISHFGTEALASLGIGFRIIQSIYLPVVAITSAMAAIVGQNFGAGKYERITQTLKTGWQVSSIIMVSGTALCLVIPALLIGIFSDDPGVKHYGVIYLTIVSLGNIVVGTIMAVSAIFQGLGKTYPTLVAAVTDNLFYAILVFTLPAYFGWGIHSVWWIKIFTAVVEMLIGGFWLKRYMGKVRRDLSTGT